MQTHVLLMYILFLLSEKLATMQILNENMHIRSLHISSLACNTCLSALNHLGIKQKSFKLSTEWQTLDTILMTPRFMAQYAI